MLMINYDFFNAIRDVNEPLGPLKIVRNQKNNFVKICIPMWIIYDLIQHADMKEIIINNIVRLGLFTLFSYLIDLIPVKHCGMDTYSMISSKRLKRLVGQLNEHKINTSYDLLLESELYEKKYKLQFDKDRLLYILEKKYVLVKTYGFNNTIKKTSILQEHVVGSKEYVLSLGTPMKKTQPRLAHAYS